MARTTKKGMNRRRWGTTKAHRTDKARKTVLEKRIREIETGRKANVDSLKTAAQNILYWQTILIMLIANLFISMALLPILIMLKGAVAAAVVVILGILLGLIFNHLIRDIEGLKKHHHFFAGIFIPATAIIDLFIITRLANSLGPALGIAGSQDSFLLSLVFIVAFLLPYVISQLVLRKR